MNHNCNICCLKFDRPNKLKDHLLSDMHQRISNLMQRQALEFQKKLEEANLEKEKALQEKELELQNEYKMQLEEQKLKAFNEKKRLELENIKLKQILNSKFDKISDSLSNSNESLLNSVSSKEISFKTELSSIQTKNIDSSSSQEFGNVTINEMENNKSLDVSNIFKNKEIISLSTKENSLQNIKRKRLRNFFKNDKIKEENEYANVNEENKNIQINIIQGIIGCNLENAILDKITRLILEENLNFIQNEKDWIEHQQSFWKSKKPTKKLEYMVGDEKMDLIDKNSTILLFDYLTSNKIINSSKDYILELAAGNGRITESVLCKLFNNIDVLEQ